MKTLKHEEMQGLAYMDADDARRRIGAHQYGLQHAAPAFGARLAHGGGIRTKAFRIQVGDGWKRRHS
ncbi:MULTISPECIES: hypothetical protein [Mesorhizobium]|uniref:hypothetical protein n=1 Tax=Mesorhizobium TaxID=68287 RepID=UPI001140AC0C|nr:MULTISPECIES: hypothetical protein [Mesorhizobium]